MLGSIAHFLDSYWYYGYIIIFLGMIIEGAGIALFTSFLAQQGHLSVPAIFLVMFGGAILGSTIWYQFGKVFCGTRIGNWFGKHFFKSKIFAALLKDNSPRTLFMSKFIYGVDRVVVVLFGLSNFDFRKFFKIELFANATWLMAIFSLGYSSGIALDHLKFYVKRIELIFLAVIVIFIIAEIMVRKKLLNKAYDYLKQQKPESEIEAN